MLVAVLFLFFSVFTLIQLDSKKIITMMTANMKVRTDEWVWKSEDDEWLCVILMIITTANHQVNQTKLTAQQNRSGWLLPTYKRNIII